MANSVATKEVTKNKRGPGSPTGNRDKYASQRYRDTLSRWTYKIQSKEGFNLTDRSLGEYISKFIEYFEFTTGQKCRVRSGDKNGYAGRWKAAATTPSFQKFEEDSWVLHFISFCMTGELYSDFNATEYLETGNESLLPRRAWEYKKIPLLLTPKQKVQESGDIQAKVEQLQNLVFSLQKKVEAMEACTKEAALSFSSLLESWVKNEAQKTQLPMDVVIMDLSNRLGAGSNTVELKDLIYGTYPIEKNRFKHYVMWIAALGILKKSNNQPYSGKELLEIPPGIALS